MFTFMFLYFVNLVLDYPLQGAFLAEYKQKNNYILFVHSAIWGIGIALALAMIGLFAWWKVLMLVVGHYLIDYWKCRGLYKKWPLKHEYDDFLGEIKKPIISDYGSLYIDQFMHIIQILLCLL